MNNNYYKLVEKFKTLLEGIKVVNSVIYARTEEKDVYKNTKFPLVHINPTTTPYRNRHVSTFTFEVGAFNQRIDGEGKDKFSDNNIIDNHNTTYAILNEFLSELEANLDMEVYEIENVSSFRPMYLSDTNGLDGWVVLVTITVANGLDLC